MFYTFCNSPLGLLILYSNGYSLTGLEFADQKARMLLPASWKENAKSQPFNEVNKQLTEYFLGQRKYFDLPTEAKGTTFQQSVWQALQEIPFGETSTYKQMATRIGRPLGMRAVGQANGHNPISIIIPCHRMIGSNGSLTGYGGGIIRKAALLKFERAVNEFGPQPLKIED